MEAHTGQNLASAADHAEEEDRPQEGFQASILRVCEKRKDDWAEAVSNRILACREDLFAWDTVYHDVCSVNFRTHRQIPIRFSSAKKPKIDSKSETPQQARQMAFLKVCEYLEENDDEQTTVADLVEKMKEYCGEEAYSPRHMKNKLTEYFGADVLISSRGKKTNVVTLRSTASTILSQFFDTPVSGDSGADKLNLIEAAAKLIKIKKMTSRG